MIQADEDSAPTSIEYERPGTTFHKVLTRAEADAEIRGWHTVADHLPVPALYGRTRRGDSDVVSYADVFVTERCDFLLGDLIAIADYDSEMVEQLEQLIDAVCSDLCRSAESTGRIARLAECVPSLYAERLQPGGRLERWYLQQRVRLDLPGAGLPASLGGLADYELQIGERAFRVDIKQVIAETRQQLDPDSLWPSALTQGDPTEPNIAWPLCWLDFEHAGLNTLAGEIANLLWYLLGLGGWLVPRYQPEVYARTLHLAWRPKAMPVFGDVGASPQDCQITFNYVWAMGSGRRAALARLVSWIYGDLGTAAGLDTANPLAGLRGFLAARILGVIPPGRLSSTDLLLCLAKLAESQHPDSRLETFAKTAHFPTTKGRSFDQHAART